MKLIIGGYAQGKLQYAVRRYGLEAEEYDIRDADVPMNAIGANQTPVINHFHSWIRERIADGGCPEEEIRLFVEKYPDCVIISDEIGNGIVPVDAGERAYRERTGRMLVELAERAEEVVRVICGIGQRIK